MLLTVGNNIIQTSPHTKVQDSLRRLQRGSYCHSVPRQSLVPLTAALLRKEHKYGEAGTGRKVGSCLVQHLPSSKPSFQLSLRSDVVILHAWSLCSVVSRSLAAAPSASGLPSAIAVPWSYHCLQGSTVVSHPRCEHDLESSILLRPSLIRSGSGPPVLRRRLEISVVGGDGRKRWYQL